MPVPWNKTTGKPRGKFSETLFHNHDIYINLKISYRKLWCRHIWTKENSWHMYSTRNCKLNSMYFETIILVHSKKKYGFVHFIFLVKKKENRTCRLYFQHQLVTYPFNTAAKSASYQYRENPLCNNTKLFVQPSSVLYSYVNIAQSKWMHQNTLHFTCTHTAHYITVR